MRKISLGQIGAAVILAVGFTQSLDAQEVEPVNYHPGKSS